MTGKRMFALNQEIENGQWEIAEVVNPADLWALAEALIAITQHCHVPDELLAAWIGEPLPWIIADVYRRYPAARPELERLKKRLAQGGNR
jgi:hypothetical protein